MEERRLRIAVDMDDTIIDSLSKHIDWYNRDFNASVTKADLQGRHFHKAIPAEHVATAKNYGHTAGFFDDLPCFPDAIEVLKTLSLQHDIYIVTAAMEYPSSFSSKYNWLIQHLPFISPLHFVFCGDKSIINADFLIDDSPHHFERFSGTAILYDAPHNSHETRHNRVNNWRDILGFFESLTP